MALQGQGLVSTLAFITGVIFIDRPWGRPTFKKWVSLPFFIAIFNTIISVFMIVDVSFNLPEAINRFNDSKTTPSRLVRVINLVCFYEYLISNTLLYFLYKIKAKKLMKLWGDLYSRNFEEAQSFKFYAKNTTRFFLGTITFLITVAVLTLEAKAVGEKYAESWIGGVIGQVPYTILLIWFLLPPFLVPLACGYAVSIATLYHLQKIYQRHCQEIYDFMESQSRNKKNAERKSRPEIIELKEAYYQEFLKIQGLFALSDEIIGPIILVVLGGGTLRLVMLSAKFIFHHQVPPRGFDQRLILDGSQWIVAVGHMYLLEVGQGMRNEFSEWKEKLRAKALDLPVMTSYDAQDAKDLFLMLDSWEWNLSAWGFFDVDRKLASGVVSLLLTYTVILVQTRIAIEGLYGLENALPGNQTVGTSPK